MILLNGYRTFGADRRFGNQNFQPLVAQRLMFGTMVWSDSKTIGVARKSSVLGAQALIVCNARHAENTVFSSKLSLKSAANVCGSMSTMLESGIEIRRAFKLAADKVGDRRCREALAEINLEIRKGEDVSSAMRKQGDYFPDLLVDMVAVAEQTGMLPEVLAQLSRHYENNLSLRKTFLASIAWPAFQFIAAIFVIAILIVVLGVVGETTGSMDMTFLVFGLSGMTGAMIWLGSVFGGFALLFFGYQVATRLFNAKKYFDPVFLKVPVLGKCLRSFAIARFSWAFSLTQQTGMPVHQSLEASLRATTNGAFIAATPRICELVQSGSSLTEALAAPGLFPNDYIEMVDVAETSGTVPEALMRLSPQFEDQARRSLRALTAAIAVLVWLCVAGFIVFFIFRFILWYVNDVIGPLL